MSDPETRSEPFSDATAGPEIRPVTDADVDALTDVYLSSARHHAGLDPALYATPERALAAERLRGLVARRARDAEYVAAVVDGHIVGSATIAALDRAGDGSMIRDVPTAEIGIAVLEDWRGRGVGAALMAHLEAWAAEHGFERLVVDLSIANDGARRLYERLGYEPYGLLMRKRPADRAG